MSYQTVWIIFWQLWWFIDYTDTFDIDIYYGIYVAHNPKGSEVSETHRTIVISGRQEENVIYNIFQTPFEHCESQKSILHTTYNFTIWGRTLKHSEAVHSSEIYRNVYQPTYQHISEDNNLHRISNLTNHLVFRKELTKYILLNKQQVLNTTGVGRSIIKPPIL
jgi:hypothetical protein